MRKISSIFCAVVALLLPALANAGENVALMSAVETLQSAQAPSSLSVPALVETPEYRVQSNPVLKVLNTGLVSTNADVAKAPVLKSAPASVASLKGTYIIQWETLSSGSYDGGSSVTVVPDAEGDSVTINNFWNGKAVRANISSEGVVTIPMQSLDSVSGLGLAYIAVITSSGTVDKTAKITGTVDADGNFTFSSWWAIWSAEGTTKDKFAAAYYNTWMARTNATMSYTTATASTSYGVRVEQTSANTLQVYNLFNRGFATTFVLNRNRTATISSQVVWINTYGSWSTIKCVSFNDSGSLTSYSTEIVTDTAAVNNNNTITWSDWSLLTTSYYAGHLLTGTLKTDADFSYPELKVSDFEGEGTEANPYKISSLDHLILLADRVNEDDNYIGTYYNNTFTRTYMGKYFEVTADIDMANYNFVPIGSSFRQRFAGTFDGKGHTIKGLKVDASSKYYAGLFGLCDTLAVLKNVVLESPVVSSDYYFAGSLVGWTLGSIENVTVNNPTVTNTARIVAGGVAGDVGGSVTNCHVYGGTITATGYVGGVTGEVIGGMTDCSAEDTYVYVSAGQYPAGGVTGNLVSNPGKNLYFKGTVTYTTYVDYEILGGIAGYVGGTTLENSFAVGTVLGYGANSLIGGAVGRLIGNVKNVYSAGRVSCASKMTGGLIGQVRSYTVTNNGVTDTVQSEITNCYTATSVYAETYQYDKNECREVIGQFYLDCTPKITNLYFDRQLSNFYSYNYGTTTAALTSAAGPEGFDAADWVFTEGYYPRVKALAETEAAKYSASAIVFDSKSNLKKLTGEVAANALGNTVYGLYKAGKLYTAGYYSSLEGGKLKIGDDFGSDTLFVVNGNTNYYYIVGVAPIPFEGDGTADSPYLLKSKSDLVALSQATTVKGQTFAETYFEMTNDIDLEYDTNFVGINANAATSSNQFNGTFDGKGYTVHKMKLNRVEFATEPTETSLGKLNTSTCQSYGGFFGRLANVGVVKNVNLAADCDIVLYGSSAALVGYNYGTIENCKNYADVLGYSCWVGGIAGQSRPESTISNCYNAGNIRSSYSNAGGIAGLAYGKVLNCVNTGDITIKNYCTNYTTQLHHAGGIAGGVTGGYVSDCVNYGTIYAARDQAGGISGALEAPLSTSYYSTDLINCLNFGTVYCGDPSLIGGLGGKSGTTAGKNSFWDVQLIPLKANGNSDADGMTGLSTAEFISGKAFEGYSTDVWDFTAGVYPTLKQFADEEKVVAARKVIVSIPEGYDAYSLLTDATLSTGAEWSLAEGKTFSIEGSTLKGPKSVSSVVVDTLFAKNSAGVVKPITIKAMPKNPLSGSGTEADPYTISTIDEWASFSEYLTATAHDYEGEFVKVTADLDFANATTTRLATDGVTSFNGTLDGDNHTVKGISLTSVANGSCALIGTVGEKGVVKNFVFEGTVTSTAYTYATGLVDKLYGALDNVVSNMTINASKAYTGGIVGQAYAGATLNKVVFKGKVNATLTYTGGLVSVSNAGVKYTDCGNEGVIKVSGTTTNSYIGGLCGKAINATFIRCYNKGEFDITNPDKVGVIGGLVGDGQGASATPEYIFEDCWNEADITGRARLAGMVAYNPSASTAAANAVYHMTRCYNTGDIITASTSAVSSSPTAGLIANYTPGSEFIDCYNTGSINSEKNIYAAGIAGSYVAAATEAKPVLFKNCYNTGHIVANGNQGGGIVGYVTSYTTLENCYNTGEIEGNQMVGGIVSAFAGTNATMKNCYNTGNVTSKLYRAGGLIAWGAPTNGVVENCWNSGNVSSTSDVVNIIAASGSSVGGLAGESGATFKNCYNVGAVTGKARVGGLVGKSTKARTSFVNCYNAGTVTAEADSCGLIIGVHTTGNGTLWTADNVVNNTYYVKQTGVTTDTVGTEVSVAELAKLNLGEAFTSADNYTYPVIADNNNEVAQFYAAQLVLADGDTESNVTTSFHVGNPGVVAWSSDCADLTFDNNDAKFAKEYSGDVTVTATLGSLVKKYNLKVAYTATGINNVSAGKNVVDEVYYTAAGVQVPKPEYADGNVYVVVVTYDDGSKAVVKLINK